MAIFYQESTLLSFESTHLKRHLTKSNSIKLCERFENLFERALLRRPMAVLSNIFLHFQELFYSNKHLLLINQLQSLFVPPSTQTVLIKRGLSSKRQVTKKEGGRACVKSLDEREVIPLFSITFNDFKKFTDNSDILCYLGDTLLTNDQSPLI